MKKIICSIVVAALFCGDLSASARIYIPKEQVTAKGLLNLMKLDPYFVLGIIRALPPDVQEELFPLINRCALNSNPDPEDIDPLVDKLFLISKNEVIGIVNTTLDDLGLSKDQLPKLARAAIEKMMSEDLPDLSEQEKKYRLLKAVVQFCEVAIASHKNRKQETEAEQAKKKLDEAKQCLKDAKQEMDAAKKAQKKQKKKKHNG
jgi:molecular chaperone DnaK (HSP70)